MQGIGSLHCLSVRRTRCDAGGKNEDTDNEAGQKRQYIIGRRAASVNAERVVHDEKGFAAEGWPCFVWQFKKGSIRIFECCL